MGFLLEPNRFHFEAEKYFSFFSFSISALKERLNIKENTDKQNDMIRKIFLECYIEQINLINYLKTNNNKGTFDYQMPESLKPAFNYFIRKNYNL